MFDIGAGELLVIVIVAIVVIGPKDMPLALRAAGRWIGKMRRMSNHFRAGVETMIREAEMAEMEKEWAQRNAEILARYPAGDEPEGGGAAQPGQPSSAAPLPPPPEAAAAAAEAAVARAAPVKAPEHGGGEPAGDGAPPR